MRMKDIEEKMKLEGYDPEDLKVIIFFLLLINLEMVT